MSIVNVLDVIGVGFLAFAAFNVQPRFLNGVATGLTLIGIGHLIVPLFA